LVSKFEKKILFSEFIPALFGLNINEDKFIANSNCRPKWNNLDKMWNWNGNLGDCQMENMPQIIDNEK